MIHNQEDEKLKKFIEEFFDLSKLDQFDSNQIEDMLIYKVKQNMKTMYSITKHLLPLVFPDVDTLGKNTIMAYVCSDTHKKYTMYQQYHMEEDWLNRMTGIILLSSLLTDEITDKDIRQNKEIIHGIVVRINMFADYMTRELERIFWQNQSCEYYVICGIYAYTRKDRNLEPLLGTNLSVLTKESMMDMMQPYMQQWSDNISLIIQLISKPKDLISLCSIGYLTKTEMVSCNPTFVGHMEQSVLENLKDVERIQDTSYTHMISFMIMDDPTCMDDLNSGESIRIDGERCDQLLKDYIVCVKGRNSKRFESFIAGCDVLVDFIKTSKHATIRRFRKERLEEIQSYQDQLHNDFASLDSRFFAYTFLKRGMIELHKIADDTLSEEFSTFLMDVVLSKMKERANGNFDIEMDDALYDAISEMIGLQKDQKDDMEEYEEDLLNIKLN